MKAEPQTKRSILSSIRPSLYQLDAHGASPAWNSFGRTLLLYCLCCWFLCSDSALWGARELTFALFSIYSHSTVHSLSHSVTNHHYARILKVIYLQARLFSRTVNLYIWLPNLLLHLFIRHFKFNVPNVHLKLNYSCFRQNMFLLQPYKYHWLHLQSSNSQNQKKN